MRMMALTKYLSLTIFAVLAIFATGCGSKKLTQPSGIQTAAVLNGSMAPGKAETRQAIVGYLFSSRNRYESGTANLVVADALTDELENYPGIQVRPRSEVSALFAQKERLLFRNYGEFTPEERKAVLAGIDPVVYGTALNVDYVIVPTVNKARLIHNRSFQTWMSSADVRMDVYHVPSGKNVYSWTGSRWEWFASTTNVFEDMAEKFYKEAIEKNAFRTSTAVTFQPTSEPVIGSAGQTNPASGLSS